MLTPPRRNKKSKFQMVEPPKPVVPPPTVSPAVPTITNPTKKNTHKPDKLFTCSLCNRSFGYKHVLQNHERTHTGEKPFHCTKCDKRFTRDHHLKTHMRLHTGERPYTCSYCARQFVQVANLRRHVRVHTGERPFSCFDCQATFSDTNQLKSHRQSHGHHTMHPANPTFNSPQYEPLNNNDEYSYENNFNNSVEVSSSFECDLCHLSFGSSDILKKHACHAASTSVSPRSSTSPDFMGNYVPQSTSLGSSSPPSSSSTPGSSPKNLRSKSIHMTVTASLMPEEYKTELLKIPEQTEPEDLSLRKPDDNRFKL
ncbi:hypothetical protein HAZT_HAZT010828 [Hyalella azteca]|nr:hypothetical protein HAZT_HAZT010828 [Hyalella azteca]